jgi:hypothetical protein
MTRRWLMALLLGMAAPAHGEDATVDSTGIVLSGILDRLHGGTDAVISAEALRTDSEFADSVRTAFRDEVATGGLDAFVRERDRGTVFRSGLNLDPQNADIRYSNVDGLTLMAPVSWHLVGGAVRLELGGGAGYAFASEAFRYRAGASARWRGWAADVTWLQLAERYGYTELVGGGWYALFGDDEHRHLRREGWRAALERSVGPVDVRVGYDRFDERSIAIADPFHISGTTTLHRSNPPITDGVRRVRWIELDRERGSFSSWALSLRGEASGNRGLAYERVLARASWAPPLPWDDILHLEGRAQLAASDGEVPIQVLADPVGRNGVRGYPQGSRIGTHALLARAELHPARDWLTRARIPLADRLRLQLIPFADVGAAWSPDGDDLSASRLPASGDWVWGAGIGLRRATGMGPVLSHLRLDFAWRLDRDIGRPVTYFVLEAEPF